MRHTFHSWNAKPSNRNVIGIFHPMPRRGRTTSSSRAGSAPTNAAQASHSAEDKPQAEQPAKGGKDTEQDGETPYLQAQERSPLAVAPDAAGVSRVRGGSLGKKISPPEPLFSFPFRKIWDP